MSDDAGTAVGAGGSESWTVRRTASWMAGDFGARGLDSPRLEAEVLLAHALGCTRMDLYLDLERPLAPDELGRVRELVRRRRAREPVAYIVGQREFWGLRIEVGAAVLVPRPETELLVELGLGGGPFARALDLCTGSGAVALALAVERPEAHVDATDVSPAAIEVARRNVALHGLDTRVSLHQGDLFAALSERAPYDLVTANPPYVTEAQWAGLAPEVRDYEPRGALVPGPLGTELHARIAAEVAGFLAPGGRVLVEVGEGQAATVAALFGSAGLGGVATHRDLRGIERVVSACR